MRLVAALLVVGLASVASADEVVFKNGDRLTGKIGELADGKLTITGTVAGDVTVKAEDVATFSSEGPVEIHLADGTVVRQRVEAGEYQGEVKVAEGGSLAPQTLQLDSVKKVNPKPVAWTGAVTASALVTRGNSDTESVNLALDLVRRAEIDRITVGAGRAYARQKDPDTGERTTTTDSWFGAVKYDYFVSEKLYLYGNVRAERDRIALLDLRLTPGVGVGYQWVERDDLNFSTEAGLSWVYEKFDNADSESHAAARLAYHFDTKLNEDVSLFHNVEFLPSLEDSSDYNLNADVGVRANFTESMFGEVKVEMRYDRTPAPGAERRDLRYTLGVGWKF